MCVQSVVYDVSSDREGHTGVDRVLWTVLSLQTLNIDVPFRVRLLIKTRM